MVEGSGTVRFDNVQAARKAIEEMNSADLQVRIFLLLYNCRCALYATGATLVSSTFGNSSNGMAFFLIVCGSANFLVPSPGVSIKSGLFIDGGGLWNCEV